jgi:hypothetical protein
MKKYLKKYEQYDSPDDEIYHDDELFGRPNYPKKDSKKDKDDDEYEEDIYSDEEFVDEDGDMERLVTLLVSYFENQGVNVDVENDGLNITILAVLDKQDKLHNLVNLFSIVKKVKKDILPQYDSEFELWESKDGRPMLYFNFDYEEGLGDDNPF